jgi:membrane protease YdiL (CAAX protease family)
MRIPAVVRSRSFVAVSVSLAILSAALAYWYLGQYALSQSSAIGIYLAFVLLLVLSLAPAWSTGRRTRSRRVLLFVPLWCLPYLIYAAGTGDFRWSALLKLFLLAASPVWIYSRFPPRRPQTFTWQDACVAIVFIGFVLSGQLRGIWNVPVNLDFMSRLFLITVATWCWTFIRPVPELGYSLRISRPVLEQAAINFALFAIIAIPSSLAMHFTRWNPKWTGPLPFLLSFLQIFLFIAVLEEIFFRGFLQTLVSKSLRSWVAGQALVSVLFGLFHVLHPPFPNWRYVALATVAGWFYGTAFRKTGSLMTSSLVHAAVDTVWRTWLSAR